MQTFSMVTRWLPGMGKRIGGDGQDHPDITDIFEEKHLGRISRAADGRFILESIRNSLASHSSSSDDGGFLSRRSGIIRTQQRASWRRPLMAYPSELSLRSDGTGQSNYGEHIIRYTSPSPSSVLINRRRGQYSQSPGSRGTRTTSPGPSYVNFTRLPENISPPTYFHRLPQVPVIYSTTSYIPTISYHVPYPTPSRTILSSSPAHTPWSPAFNYSDLSSVPIPSSAERSFPSSFTTPPSCLQLKTVHERYSQELPSLNAIHQEHTRWKGAYFVPVQPSPPRIRIQSQWGEYRRARLPPRHARHARSAPELTTNEEHPPTGLLMETSPESRSSSSGFGSKNTSQQNQSSQSGSTSEWRLPPYRPPPPPPPKHRQQPQIQIPYYTHLSPPHSSELQQQYIIGDWLDFTNVHEASPASDLTKVDASVDGHYEFDAVFTTTPTPPITITYPRQRVTSSDEPTRPKRTKYDNIEARVQAMKVEFHQFRRRQEKRRKSEEVESMC